MKATDFLRQQHVQARSAISQLLQVDDPSERETLRAELVQALRGHMVIEEEKVYPRFEDREETEEIIEQSFADHDELKEILTDFERCSADEPEFDSLLNEIEEAVEAHVSMEEDELLPRIESAWTPDLMEQIGAELQRRYESFLSGEAGEELFV